MGSTVILVGHCGPDSTHLRMTIKKAIPDAVITMADDSAELSAVLESSTPDLVLFNRELGYGFKPDTGVEYIRDLRAAYPHLKMILVTNYPDVQQQAVAMGALPGFGKRELGTPRVTQILQSAVASAVRV